MMRADLVGKGMSTGKPTGGTTMRLGIALAGPNIPGTSQVLVIQVLWLGEVCYFVFVLGSPVPEFLDTSTDRSSSWVTDSMSLCFRAVRVDSLACAKAAALEPLLGPKQASAVALPLPLLRSITAFPLSPVRRASSFNVFLHCVCVWITCVLCVGRDHSFRNKPLEM